MLYGRSRVMILVVILLALILLIGCGSPNLGGGLNPPQMSVLSSSVQRESSPAVGAAELAELVKGNNAFAFDLYRALREKEGNLFYSPYSLSVALSMTYAGARNATAQQMASTLYYTLPPSQLHPAFNALDLKLTPSDQSSFKLSVANALWGQSGFPFVKEFLDTLARNYGAGLRVLDFTAPARRESARQTINNWVSEQTAGKIKDLIGPDVLNEHTRLVLTNAIYFKGEWENPFNPAEDGEFHTLRGDRVSVPIMSRRAIFGYTAGTGYEAIELPYKGDRISMVIVLPNAGQFENVECALDAAQFQGVLSSLKEQDIKVYLPKFRYDSRFSLGSTLAAMGMGDAFDRGRADFTGMYDSSKVGERLFISEVVHDAFISVDERGTEAAGATGVIMEVTSLPKEVRVDRPFIFAIRDRQTGSILFVGRVLDPSH